MRQGRKAVGKTASDLNQRKAVACHGDNIGSDAWHTPTMCSGSKCSRVPTRPRSARLGAPLRHALSGTVLLLLMSVPFARAEEGNCTNTTGPCVNFVVDTRAAAIIAINGTRCYCVNECLWSALLQIWAEQCHTSVRMSLLNCQFAESLPRSLDTLCMAVTLWR